MANLAEFQAQGLSGFGTGDQADVGELVKALTAGYQVGAGRTGGSALRVESLEASLKVLTYTASHIKFWKKIPKSVAYNTVEEYTQLTQYGTGGFPFVQEGELGQEQSSSYVRKQALVKFMCTTRSISHVATVINPAHGDLIALENQNGIMWLLEQIETFLFTGNSALAFSGQSEQFDGLDAMIDPTMVVDMRGSAIGETDLEEATNQIIENYGFPTDLFLNTRAQSDLVKQFYPRQRFNMPAPVNGSIGMSVGSVMTQAGPIELNPEVFIRRAPSPVASATAASAPATPTSVVAGALTGNTGDFTKGDPATSATTYVNYVVTACNRFGESAPTAVQGAAVAVSAVNKANGAYIPLTITNSAAVGANPPEYFRIYRSSAQTANAVPSTMDKYSLIAQVPAASQANSGTTGYNDLNLYLPFTSTAYLGELRESVLTFRQLLPMMKMDLAVLAPSFRWMILLYGTPILQAPKKWLRFINVGVLVTPR
jgi:hypothetical protein